MGKKVPAKQPEPLWARPLLRGMSMNRMVHRVGALNILGMPSRMGNTLYYPDGRVVKDKSSI